MSRTYRRKNTQLPPWSFSHLATLPDGTWEYVAHTGKEYKRDKAIFHSEKETWNWHVPSDFRRVYNRSRRRKQNNILSRAIRDANDEPMFIRERNNVAYDYW